MKLKKNDSFVSEIIDITNLGFGVAKVDGAVVFVSGTVPQDVARIKIIKVGSSYSVGRVEELITPSPLRFEGRCANGGCRSCAYKYGVPTVAAVVAPTNAFPMSLKRGLRRRQCDRFSKKVGLMR